MKSQLMFAAPVTARVAMIFYVRAAKKSIELVCFIVF